MGLNPNPAQESLGSASRGLVPIAVEKDNMPTPDLDVRNGTLTVAEDSERRLMETT
jgi:hypothetical protein